MLGLCQGRLLDPDLPSGDSFKEVRRVGLLKTQEPPSC